jgi:tubulin gamma
MLANHTSVREIFIRCASQYEKLMRRKAFVDQYEQYGVLSDGLMEFQNSHELVTQLVDEYAACEMAS